MGWAMVLLVVSATSLCSALLTAAALYLLFLRKIGPMLEQKLAEAEATATRILEEARETADALLDQKLEEVKVIASSVEGHVAAGVREGIKSSVTEVPTSAVKDTVNVARRGAGFLEGSLASVFKKKKP